MTNTCSTADEVLKWGSVAFLGLCALVAFLAFSLRVIFLVFDDYCFGNRNDYKMCRQPNHDTCKNLDLSRKACDKMNRLGYKVKKDTGSEGAGTRFGSSRTDSAATLV